MNDCDRLELSRGSNPFAFQEWAFYHDEMKVRKVRQDWLQDLSLNESFHVNSHSNANINTSVEEQHRVTFIRDVRSIPQHMVSQIQLLFYSNHDLECVFKRRKNTETKPLLLILWCSGIVLKYRTMTKWLLFVLYHVRRKGHFEILLSAIGWIWL